MSDDLKLKPLECVLVTQGENGETIIKHFTDEIALAFYLVEQCYGEVMLARGLTINGVKL